MLHDEDEDRPIIVNPPDVNIDVDALSNEELRATPIPTQPWGAWYASPAGGRRRFNVSSNYVPFSSNKETAIAALINPPNSGVDLYFDVGEFGSSVNTRFRRYGGVNITVTGDGIVPANAGGGSQQSKARMYTAPNISFTGGTVRKTAYISGFSQYITTIAGGVVVRPGGAMVWTIVPVGNNNVSGEASVFLEWVELTAALTTAT